MADLDKFTEYLNKQADLLDRGIIDQQQYNDAVKDAKAGLIGYSEALRASTNQLKKSILGLGLAMIEGKQGASVYNKSISGAADVIDTVASKFGFLGKLFGTMVTAGAKYVVAVNEQADKLFETYQDMSRTGLATGMDDVFNNLHGMGYTVKEIGNLANLMKENSNTLANFGGTAANGAKQFTEISRTLQYSDVATGFKRMGMSVDDINKGTANYISIQNLTGSLRKQTNEQLAEGAQAYIEQQDRLTKLTGLNAETQNQIVAQALSDQRYNATQAELEAKGDAESLATAKRNNELLVQYTAQFGPKTARAFQDYASGMMNSADAQKFQRAFPQAAKMIDQGIKDSSAIMDAAHQDADEDRKRYVSIAKQGKANEILTDYAEIVKGAGLNAKDRARDADATAKEEQAGQKAGKDPAVKAMVDLTQSQRNQTMAAEKLINDGINPVTSGVAAFSEAVEAVTDLGGGLMGRGPGMGAKPTTAPSGPPTTPTTGLDPSALINFSGGTGDLSHFKQLNPTVYNSFLAMADEYFKNSGKKLQVNSAFRSIDEQKNVDSGTNPKAAPGKSLHNVGKALDINSSQVAELTAKGLLSKFGFGTLPGDPPHIQMPQAATGGILSGPQSGYQAMLHGTEAVVPMNNKQAITVQQPANSGMSEQIKVISMKINTLDSLISGMQKNTDLANKILQRTA